MASRTIPSKCSQVAGHMPLSAARVIFQQGHQRFYHSTPPLVLDFLAPRVAFSNHNRSWSSVLKSPQRSFIETRSFSSSSKASRIINPRKDDEGNVMSVELTPRASHRLKHIMAKDSNPDLALRVTVTSGGCHGLQYLLSTVTLPQAEGTSSSPMTDNEGKENILDEEDTVFVDDGARVVIDGPSLELLKGSKIDYTMELIGSQFTVDNPKATSSCGCGTSFDIKL